MVDCGLFVLEYAERFMDDVTQVLNKDVMRYAEDNEVEQLSLKYEEHLACSVDEGEAETFSE